MCQLCSQSSHTTVVSLSTAAGPSAARLSRISISFSFSVSLFSPNKETRISPCGHVPRKFGRRENYGRVRNTKAAKHTVIVWSDALLYLTLLYITWRIGTDENAGVVPPVDGEPVVSPCVMFNR